MAYVEAVSTGTGEALLYNIEQAVGANGVNDPGDVKLVQYLLRAHYGVRAGSLAMDGWGGPSTNAWIKAFQEDMAAEGNNVLVDGRFDRAFGTTSSVSQTVYAMVLLNLSVARNNPAAFRALPGVVELNPNPRANPYGDTRRINMLRHTGDRVEVLYMDGTTATYVVRGDFIIKAGGETNYVSPGQTYVCLPDGRLISMDQPTTPMWE
jgi:hypothetical protein